MEDHQARNGDEKSEVEFSDAPRSSSAPVTASAAPTEENTTRGEELAASGDAGTSQAETSFREQQFDKDDLFRRIAGHGDKVFYKHQQRGEADLTEDEKLEILERILSTEPTLFLERYHSFISPGNRAYLNLIVANFSQI